ncbi:MAG: alcohol dehydrogenase catalytic domain-containing protein [Nitrospiraceae bacterium]|nr:alcohol dehydrogenase catalytic domain-containing protein [Nitrospiraceae bacterium]
MLTSFLLKPGKIELRDIPAPTPGNGEVLVRIKAALTCGTDLKAYQRGHPMIPMPGPFGHEFSGIIEQTGHGVNGFSEGDEVMCVHSAPCGGCSYCNAGRFNLCENIMDTKVLGAFADHILLPQHIVRQNLFIKPSSVSFETAAMLEPLSCVVHGINQLDIREGSTVVVMGSGPIGLLHLAILKRKRARVIVTARNMERLNIAGQLGADACVQPDRLHEAVNSLTNKIGVDFVIECTGQAEVWERSVDYARRGGTIMLFGGCKTGTRVSYDTYRLHYDELTLKGAFHFTPADVAEAKKLLEQGLDISSIITGSYPLVDLEKALVRLGKSDGLKYAIIP